jgi:hypothetical protein
METSVNICALKKSHRSLSLLDNPDFVVRQAMQFIGEAVNRAVGGGGFGAVQTLVGRSGETHHPTGILRPRKAVVYPSGLGEQVIKKLGFGV